MMNDQILTFLTTAGGLALGWTLNEFSGYFKSRRGRRQVLNRILFHQFSIREVIFKTDIAAMEKAIAQVLAKEFKPGQQEDLRILSAKIFEAFLRSELDRRFSSHIKVLISAYKNAIIELSGVDPYVTYQISDKDVVLDYLSSLDDYFNFLENHLQTSGQNNSQQGDLSGAMSLIRQTVTPYVRESALETIEADILLVARAKGYFSVFKAWLFLRKRREITLDQNAVAKIERYIKSFASQPG